MSDRAAFGLAALVLALLAADVLLFEAAAVTFLARRGIELIEWMAFWR